VDRAPDRGRGGRRAAGAVGRSNSAIAQRLVISEKAVSKHCTSIVGQLGLPPSEDDNRRVLAVLAYLDR
jgi:DNA-binding NarL/FixJ family response regulator